MNVVPGIRNTALESYCDYRRHSPQDSYQADDKTVSAVTGQGRDITKERNERELRETDTCYTQKRH